MPTTSPRGNRYILTIVDDYSRFCIVMLLKQKSDVAGALRDCFTMLENQFERRVKILWTDNGKEYVNQDVKDYCREKGIRRQLTIAHTPEQNGVAERRNRYLTEMSKCMLLDAGLHDKLWAEAVRTAAYLHNRLPSRAVKKTPYEMWYGRKPNIELLRIFGSKFYTHISKNICRKWDDKAN